ncbi:MAG: nucleotidyltransferase family protein [Clostridiales bacterium]|nr:nucleotidyltransferase family protein [Clostridiales bacterium]
MGIAGIIAEYDPLHEGHLHLIRKVKEEMGEATPVVVIMSGDFVQRGEPALLNRASRVAAVLQCGADVVFELPFTFATGSADRFALGAVRSLSQSGAVTDLFFGCEHESLSDLEAIASIDFEEDPLFTSTLQDAQKEGQPYAAAWEMAACAVLSEKKSSLSPEILSSIVRRPNNTLAISYLREIRRCGSSITPHLVKREGDYHGGELNLGTFPSATALRLFVLSAFSSYTHEEFIGKLSELQGFVPVAQLAEMLSQWNNHTRPMGPLDLIRSVFPILKSRTADDLSSTAYMGQGLASHLKNSIRSLHYQEGKPIDEIFMDQVDTKCFSNTRIMRALTSLAIGQTEADLKNLDTPKYLRLLGFSEAGRTVLKTMRQDSSLPILSRASDAFHHGKDPAFARMDELDRLSHDWWTLQARSTWEEDFRFEVIQYKRKKIYRTL